jgi:hypothetical protein
VEFLLGLTGLSMKVSGSMTRNTERVSYSYLKVIESSVFGSMMSFQDLYKFTTVLVVLLKFAITRT